MFIPFEELDRDHRLEADLCIIGTGAAGITLATEFIGHPAKVIVIESGGATPDAETTDLHRGGMAPGGRFHHGIHEGRARVFGGTTTLWGGQARELEPIDFERRPWVAGSGWPFGADELTPYFPRAGKILGLRDVAFDEDTHAAFGVKRPGFNPEAVKWIYSRWSPQPNFATAYRQRLATAENVHVVLRANVTQIVLAQDGSRVEQLELRSLTGGSAIVRAKAFVLCCGGIETPRILLASNRVQPAGIGNTHDLVGRYFQDHLAVRWADFEPAHPSRVDEFFNSFFRGQTKYYPLLTAGKKFQQRHEILNISAAVIQDVSPPESVMEVSKRLFRAVRGRRFGAISLVDGVKVASHTPEMLRAAYRVLGKRRSYVAPGTAHFLGSTIEQEPDRDSRVLLDDTQLDALGMPRACLHWKLTPLVGKTLRVFAHAIHDEFKRVGLGTVKLYPWILTGDDECSERVRDVYHHMGTTRMHADPRQGVVDVDCRVHGVKNLYISSSSVFPTGGHSNPTFTLLLLCFRLADLLKRELRQLA